MDNETAEDILLDKETAEATVIEPEEHYAMLAHKNLLLIAESSW